MCVNVYINIYVYIFIYIYIDIFTYIFMWCVTTQNAVSSRGSYHGGSPQTMGLTSYASYKFPVASNSGCSNVCI